MDKSNISCEKDIDGNVHVKAHIKAEDLLLLRADPVARLILDQGSNTASNWCLLMESIFHTERPSLLNGMRKESKCMLRGSECMPLCPDDCAKQGYCKGNAPVTRESAIQAIAHVAQYNGSGREQEARDMLVSTND